MRRGHQGLAYTRQLHYLPVEGALDINIVTLLHRFESLVHRVIVKVVAHADEHRALGLQALDLRETLRKGCRMSDGSGRAITGDRESERGGDGTEVRAVRPFNEERIYDEQLDGTEAEELIARLV